MRKQYNRFYALVVAELKDDPLSEDLFLFAKRCRTRAKVLLCDGALALAEADRASSVRTAMASRRIRIVRDEAQRAGALPGRQHIGSCLTSLAVADLPATSHSLPPRDPALLNLATEAKSERLRQGELLLEKADARPFRRLEQLTTERREARRPGASSSRWRT
jgi:hypothetical protein